MESETTSEEATTVGELIHAVYSQLVKRYPEDVAAVITASIINNFIEQQRCGES